MRRIALLLILVASGWAGAQPIVVPSDRVVTGVRIRASASTSSNELGKFIPGEQAQFLGEVPRWVRIQHPLHGEGFVSKPWVQIITEEQATSDTEFDVYVVDVGTGLAVFVQGQDFNLIYDAGSNDDRAGNRFLDFLDTVSRGLSQISHVVISHAHQDHIEMLADVFKRTQVQEIWDSGVVYASCTYQDLLEAIATEGAEYHTAVHGVGTQEIAFLRECSTTGDGVTMDFAKRIEPGSVALGERASMTFLYVDGTPRSDLNENSLVVMLDLDSTKILLPGDSGGGRRSDPSERPETGSVEDALLRCCEDMLAADILVLAITAA